MKNQSTIFHGKRKNTGIQDLVKIVGDNLSYAEKSS